MPARIVSLITLAVLSYERLCTILGTAAADSRSYSPALLGICFSWLYAVAWTVPPLLGWSSYGPEGPGVSCSVDWRTQTANNVSYILCLFLFCLVLPFAVILYCYGRLLLAVRQVSRVSTPLSRRREQRVLLMVVTMVSCYLLCWLPYGVVALLSTFGPRDAVGPVVSVVPSLLAKSSTVVNPIIYIFMNKQVSAPSLPLCVCNYRATPLVKDPVLRQLLGPEGTEAGQRAGHQPEPLEIIGVVAGSPVVVVNHTIEGVLVKRRGETALELEPLGIALDVTQRFPSAQLSLMHSNTPSTRVEGDGSKSNQRTEKLDRSNSEASSWES
ncbi:unnamed protein product [Boreogadus saida]